MDASASDHALAAALATAARDLLVALRGEGASGEALGREGDRRANALLTAALHDARPGDALISEETPDDPERLRARRVWIVDPLDGTRDFAGGSDEWAVHVGLAVDGVATAGAVATPGGVWTNTSPRHVRRGGPLRMVISRWRAPAETARVAAALGAEVVPMGSAGAKAMAVVTGTADLYLHTGGQHEWDSCAPVAVAAGHGLHASRLSGLPLRYNQPDLSMPDLLICRPELAASVLIALREPDSG